MSLRCIDMNPAAWGEEASDRDQWRRKIYQGMENVEAQRVRQDEDMRVARRERQALAAQRAPTVPCNYCPRIFRGQLGLASHVRHQHRRGGAQARRTRRN